jgi:hypothetical protein
MPHEMLLMDSAQQNSAVGETMKVELSLKILLFVIAISLSAIALHPYIVPPVVSAQSGVNGIYVEPGVYMLRAPDGSQQVLGKVVVDLHNGNVWGFPTLQQDPYPAAGAKTSLPTSHPFLLGKYSLGDAEK